MFSNAEIVLARLQEQSKSASTDATGLLPILADGTPFIIDESCVPWPCIEEFDPRDVVVGSTDCFEWIASGPRALLWDVERGRYARLLETSDSVVDILASRVQGHESVWWVFLLTSTGVTWVALDCELGSVSPIGFSTLAAGGKLVGANDRLFAVLENACVVQLMPRPLTGTISIIGNQSWGRWITSLYKPADMVDYAVSLDEEMLYVLDTRCVLSAWATSGDERPAVTWSTTLQELPKVRQMYFKAPSEMVFVQSDGTRHVLDVNANPGPLSKAKQGSALTKSQSCLSCRHATRFGAVTAMVDSEGRVTTVTTEMQPIHLGEKRLMDVTLAFASDGDARVAAIRFPLPDLCVVSVVGTRGVSRLQVLSPSRTLARCAAEDRLGSMMPLLFAACAAPTEIAKKLLYAGTTLVQDADSDVQPGTGRAVSAIAQAVSSITAPSITSSTSAKLSPAAEALFDIVGERLGGEWRAPNIVEVPEEGLREAKKELSILRTLIDAIYADQGWLDSTNSDPVTNASWRQSEDGLTLHCAHDRRHPLTESAAIGEQAKLLSALARALGRLDVFVRLLILAHELDSQWSSDAVIAPLEILQATDDRRNTFNRTVTTLARNLCEGSSAGTNGVLNLLDSLPDDVRTICGAWLLAWSPAREDAVEYLRTNSVLLWETNGLAALERKLLRDASESLSMLGSLYEQASFSAEPKAIKQYASDRLIATLEDAKDDADRLTALVRATWNKLPASMQKNVAGWLLNQEPGPLGLHLADLFAAGPSAILQRFVSVPSACAAAYFKSKGEMERAAATYCAVAQADGTSLHRRRACVRAAKDCVAGHPAQLHELEELDKSLAIQQELLEIVSRFANSGEVDPDQADVVQQHLTLLDAMYLDAGVLYQCSQQYRPYGGALIELKLLAKEQTAEERFWAEAIEAAVSAATSECSSPTAIAVTVQSLCEAVVRESKTYKANLPLYYVVSLLEALCPDDDERLQCLMRGGASVDDIFDSYLIILEEPRALLYPEYTPNAVRTLRTMAHFVTQIVGFTADERSKRLFTAVEARVKRLAAVARLGSQSLAPEDQRLLNEAQAMLEECEDHVAGGMGFALGSQQSWVF
jgi:hypothetical protein